jgi:hypothetical protein
MAIEIPFILVGLGILGAIFRRRGGKKASLKHMQVKQWRDAVRNRWGSISFVYNKKYKQWYAFSDCRIVGIWSAEDKYIIKKKRKESP